jgi:6-phospho-beta-glucosidase
VIALVRAVPIMYVDHYYYNRHKTLEELRRGGQTRAQQIMDIEKEIFRQAADPALAAKPQALQQRGGLGYSDITFEFLNAIRHDRGKELVCTVLNHGAVDGIDAEGGVEVVCRVGRQGPRALPVGPIPLAYRGLIQAVKAYESLTVQAAVEGRRELAVLALTNHPLVGDHALAESLVEDLSAAHSIKWRRE